MGLCTRSCCGRRPVQTQALSEAILIRRSPSSTLQAKGRITVPHAVRKRTGWKVGEKLVIELTEDFAITLQPKRKAKAKKKVRK